VARRKKTKRKTRKPFKVGISTFKPKMLHNFNTMDALKVLVLIIALIAAGFGFAFLKRYVSARSGKTAFLELVDVPFWVTESLKDKIHTAAGVYTDELIIDEDTARTIQQNIRSQTVWLDDIKVQTTHNRILIQGRWRKPVASVKTGKRICYLDTEMVVLDYLPLKKLPIVRIEGLPRKTKAPASGEYWQSDNIAAAMAVLSRLEQMDNLVTPDKPLLYEISSIDISNYNGRKSTDKPHIVLYTTDETKIIWGAEIETWQRHLEAPDEEKLTNLYAYYKKNGTLLGGAKYIDLQYSQQKVSLPIDKY
jgi:hypothetical protein